MSGTSRRKRLAEILSTPEGREEHLRVNLEMAEEEIECYRKLLALADAVVDALTAEFKNAGTCPECLTWDSEAPIEHDEDCKIGLALAALPPKEPPE